MTDEGPPMFTSFEAAWAWFGGGGALVSRDSWRDRLTGGRAQLLSFQVPMAETAIADEVEELKSALEDIEGLAMFEREMLHVSLRGVGFQVIAKKRADDVSREDVGRITKQATGQLKGVKPFEVRAGPLNVFPDALILEVHDGGELATLRGRLAPTMDDAFRIEAGQYLPHITIAMFTDPVAAARGLRERLPALRQRPAVATKIKRVELARWWFTGHDADFPEREPVRTYALR